MPRRQHRFAFASIDTSHRMTAELPLTCRSSLKSGHAFFISTVRYHYEIGRASSRVEFFAIRRGTPIFTPNWRDPDASTRCKVISMAM